MSDLLGGGVGDVGDVDDCSAARTPRPQPASWDEARRAVDDALTTASRQAATLTNHVMNVRAGRAHIENARMQHPGWLAEIDSRLTEVRDCHRRLTTSLSQPGLASAPAPVVNRRSWEVHQVALADGVQFSAVIDGGVEDPVSAALASGQLVNPLVDLMLDIVRPRDRVLDIGAHVGTFTLAAAAAGCLVLAIEASPGNAALLRASVVANGFNGVHVVNAAASDAPATVEFLSRGPWGHIAWDGAETALTEGGGDVVSVPAVAIGHLITELGWDAVSFIKMDIEGSEPRALAGLEALLRSPRAPVLLFESNGHTLLLAGSTARQLLEQVEAAGYSLFMVEPDRRLIRISAADPQPQTLVDCLAIRQRPPGLGDWTIIQSLTDDDRLERVLADCRSPNPDCRAYIAGALADFDSDFLARADIFAALDTLSRDPRDAVREAARWWSTRESPTATGTQGASPCQ